MQSIANLVALNKPAKKDNSFRVLQISFDFFCVYSGTALIDIHADWVTADAHCQRLRSQQGSE
jgi:hypothetical protein